MGPEAAKHQGQLGGSTQAGLLLPAKDSVKDSVKEGSWLIERKGSISRKQQEGFPSIFLLVLPVVIFSGVLYPVKTMPDSLLDRHLAQSQFATRHGVTVAAPRARVYRAARELDFSGSRLLGVLWRARGLPRRAMSMTSLDKMGFTLLDEREGDEFVLGIVGRFWRLRGDLVRVAPEAFAEWDEPGYVKAVWGFRVEGGTATASGPADRAAAPGDPPPDAARLVTETRIRCTDGWSLRRFRPYWAVVRPFSSLVRREILDQAAQAACGPRELTPPPEASPEPDAGRRAERSSSGDALSPGHAGSPGHAASPDDALPPGAPSSHGDADMPNHLRRRDRGKDDAWIRAFLHRALWGVLATAAAGRPFVNSNLFVFDEGEHCVYLHTARTGRTPENVAAGGPAAFTVSTMGRFLPADEALEFSVEYAGVVVFGTVAPVDDEDRKRAALEQIMEKYAPHLAPGKDYRPVTGPETARTGVHRLRIEAWSGKEKRAATEFPGAYRFPLEDHFTDPARTLDPSEAWPDGRGASLADLEHGDAEA